MWKPEEEEILKCHHKKGARYVQENFLKNKTLNAIRNKCLRLGLIKFSKKRAWKKRDIEFLKENYYKLSSMELSKKLERSPSSIMQKARSIGLAYWDKPINKDANFYYFAGFIAADGNLYHKKGHGYKISSTIAENDGYILSSFSILFGGSCRQVGKDNSIYCRYELYSKKLFKELVSIGVTPKKSKTLNIKWKMIPEEYIWDFIRGYFDGDGCIKKFPKRNYFIINFCSASKEFIAGLRKVLISQAKVSKNRNPYYNKSAKVHYLEYGKNDSMLIMKYFLTDKISLVRKQKRILESLNMFKKDGEVKVYKADKKVSPKVADEDAERYTVDDLVRDSQLKEEKETVESKEE